MGIVSGCRGGRWLPYGVARCWLPETGAAAGARAKKGWAAHGGGGNREMGVTAMVKKAGGGGRGGGGNRIAGTTGMQGVGSQKPALRGCAGEKGRAACGGGGNCKTSVTAVQGVGSQKPELWQARRRKKPGARGGGGNRVTAAAAIGVERHWRPETGAAAGAQAKKAGGRAAGVEIVKRVPQPSCWRLETGAAAGTRAKEAGGHAAGGGNRETGATAIVSGCRGGRQSPQGVARPWRLETGAAAGARAKKAGRCAAGVEIVKRAPKPSHWRPETGAVAGARAKKAGRCAAGVEIVKRAPKPSKALAARNRRCGSCVGEKSRGVRGGGGNRETGATAIVSGYRGGGSWLWGVRPHRREETGGTARAQAKKSGQRAVGVKSASAPHRHREQARGKEKVVVLGERGGSAETGGAASVIIADSWHRGGVYSMEEMVPSAGIKRGWPGVPELGGSRRVSARDDISFPHIRLDDGKQAFSGWGRARLSIVTKLDNVPQLRYIMTNKESTVIIPNLGPVKRIIQIADAEDPQCARAGLPDGDICFVFEKKIPQELEIIGVIVQQLLMNARIAGSRKVYSFDRRIIESRYLPEVPETHTCFKFDIEATPVSKKFRGTRGNNEDLPHGNAMSRYDDNQERDY
ncbi:hypothetical protein C8J57DRAFT_1233086 [Mycena rebaudengoi]|nr:hypothetical protein C8J57DRAFT_1233086 [Mycena rebaudengoi]